MKLVMKVALIYGVTLTLSEENADRIIANDTR
jgi:hypothetical protein